MPAMYCSGLTAKSSARPPSTRLTTPIHRGYAACRNAATATASAASPAVPHSHGIVPIQWEKKAAVSGTSTPGSAVLNTNSVVRPLPSSWATATSSRPLAAMPGHRLSAGRRRARSRCRPTANAVSSSAETMVATWKVRICGTSSESRSVMATASPSTSFS